jgi:hypothetical protein
MWIAVSLDREGRAGVQVHFVPQGRNHIAHSMAREINLDGGEILVLKALGLGGAESDGATLMSKIPSMDAYELMDVLKNLIMMGYVDSDKSSFYDKDEFGRINFQVNPGYSRDLREALDPTPEVRSKRVRRE